MKISFASPTGVEGFDVVGKLDANYCPLVGNSHYNVGTMTLHLAGGQVVTTDLDISGSVVSGGYRPLNWSGSQYDVSFSGTVSLSQYGPLSEIDLHPYRIPFCDAGGSPGVPWADDDWIGGQEFGIDNLDLITTFRPALLSLTAADAADPANHVTATDTAGADLYLLANGNDAVEVDFTAAFTLPTYDSSPTGYYVNLVVTRDDAPTVAVYQTNWYWEPSGTSLGPVLLEATPGAQSFTAVLTLTVGGVVLGTATEQIDLCSPRFGRTPKVASTAQGRSSPTGTTIARGRMSR